jgi:MSHA biogenesis protein MshM
VQLLNVDSERQDEVVDFLATRTPALDAQRLHVYRSNLSGRDRIGVVYGDYASRKEADADRRRLARICGGAPYVRPLSKLR